MTAVTLAVRCRHCAWRTMSRPRGLCDRCSRTPAVRTLFPGVPQRVGLGLGNRLCPLPAEPTTAPPGSPAKVAVLTARAAAGLALWHPLDATDFD